MSRLGCGLFIGLGGGGFIVFAEKNLKELVGWYQDFVHAGERWGASNFGIPVEGALS